MSLYRCTIALDGEDRRQINIHWDDNDPNRLIVAPYDVAAVGFDEQRLADVVGTMGFSIASTCSDNVGRGWAIVSRLNRDRPFFNPVDHRWYSFLPDDVQREIRAKYPDADVPGVH